MKKRLVGIATLSFGLLLGGCMAPEVAVIDSRSHTPSAKIEGELEEGLFVKSTDSNHDGDLLSVSVEIGNERNSVARFEYRYLWFDNQGKLFETPTSRWMVKSLSGTDTAILPGIAPHTSVTDYVLKIRAHK